MPFDKKSKLKNASHSDSDEDNDEDFDIKEYRKFLGKIFPSKYINDKIKQDEDNKRKTKESKKPIMKKYKHRSPKKQTKYNTRQKINNRAYKKKKDESYYDSDSNDDHDEDSEESDSDYDEDEDADEENTETECDEDESESESESGDDDDDKNINIVLTINNKQLNESDEELSETENSNDEEEDIEDNESDDSDSYKENTNNKKKTTQRKNNNSDNPIIKSLSNIKNDKNDKNDKLIDKCIQSCNAIIVENEKQKTKQEKKFKEKNLKLFKKYNQDKLNNETAYYKEMSIDEQAKINNELKSINNVLKTKKPYKMMILESDIPLQFKASALSKINTLKYMDSSGGEYYKVKNWVDGFMKIPFNQYKHLPVNIDDGVDKCHDFMENAQSILDSAVYGLNDAKTQIMQMVGQFITNPAAVGSSIAIHGPPGTGKTSLVKEGISKILNRPFAFIPLGGSTDSSFLEGHSYTYEGSTWGKIIQVLMDSQCMNPVIFFDELDKVSGTPRGDEIIGILTHLTDTTQNTQFHDKYYSDLNFDLSKCLFIFSYNDESKINPVLKDRMYRIQTKGYGQKEKCKIANTYLLPTIRNQVKFNEQDIIISDIAINYIIENHKICQKEDGVRNLKRCLEIIYTKYIKRIKNKQITRYDEELKKNYKMSKSRLKTTVF